MGGLTEVDKDPGGALPEVLDDRGDFDHRSSFLCCCCQRGDGGILGLLLLTFYCDLDVGIRVNQSRECRFRPVSFNPH